jgi:hypothetical protein
MNYTDVSIMDISDPCFVDIAGESIDDLRTSADYTRVIIKWEGDCPGWLKYLNPIIRTQQEARSYYTRQNGWI